MTDVPVRIRPPCKLAPLRVEPDFLAKNVELATGEKVKLRKGETATWIGSEAVAEEQVGVWVRLRTEASAETESADGWTRAWFKGKMLLESPDGSDLKIPLPVRCAAMARER
eukprot:SAG11_NODE_17572_length_514_cov_1.354217_1_plen_112_part_00